MNHAQRQTARSLADAYAELQNLLLDSPAVTDFLQQVAVVTASLVPDTSCGVATRRDHQVITVASSDELAMRLDEVKYHGGQGPCLHALHTGEVVEIADLATDGRWPDYRMRALADGVASSYSVPLIVGDTTVGAVNLYSRVPRAFTDADHHEIQAFTRQAGVALTLLLRHAQHATIDSQLQDALSTRSIVDQALGIIMGQQCVTSVEAFARLRATSQNNNRKLVDVATGLITTATGQPPQPARPFTDRS